ncbi:MAG: NUDIX domain-containing protein [Christensenellales bacterium]
MSVRNSAKAIVVKDGEILLNRCSSRLGQYYALPGGGQREGETLQEALVREVLEETGLRVRPERLCGVYEHIAARRADGNDHKIYFVFFCTPEGKGREKPTERDAFQLGSQWVKLEDIPYTRLFPIAIRDNLMRMLSSEDALFLGSVRKK